MNRNLAYEKFYERLYNIINSKDSIKDSKIKRKIDYGIREVMLNLKNQNTGELNDILNAIEDDFKGNGELKKLKMQYIVSDEIQTLNDKQKEELCFCKCKLKNAMLKKNNREIINVANKIKNILGKQAGLPEEQAVYFKYKDDKSKVVKKDIEKLIEYFIDNINYNDIAYWCKGRLKDSKRPEVYLRTGASMIEDSLAAIKYGCADENRFLGYVKDGLDSMMTVQASNGVFPFPDMRGINPWFGPMIERAFKGINENDYTKNGWIFETPRGDGGLQFDNALCASVLLDGYELFQNNLYLVSAIRASEWAIKQDIVVNWNYNAFSVMLLAKMYSVINEKKYLEASIVKFMLGILPGQSDSGRWIDAHNAKTCYHIIIMKAGLSLLEVMDPKDSRFDAVKNSIYIGIKSLTKEIVDKGANHQNDAIIILNNFDRLFGFYEFVDKAINVLINSIYYQHENSDVFLPSVSCASSLGITLCGAYNLYQYFLRREKAIEKDQE